ncbi:MAG: hypothetical protein RTU63_14475 [Candidatus Thorarchaeota archaeon]
MSILEIILKLQSDPPLALEFAEIYDQLLKDNPSTKLTKAWVHRVLKMLTEAKLVRLDNPSAHRKKYVADVNTLMAGFEEIKNTKIEDLETKQLDIEKEIAELSALDCGYLSKEYVKGVTGRSEDVSSRIVRGVEELHRVLRFNMLEKAGEGDIIRATLLWAGPWMNESIKARIQRFFDAAENGADVRYLISTDILQAEEDAGFQQSLQSLMGMVQVVHDLKDRGKMFDGRFYAGPKTYNQVSFNNESMALIIAENPVTATWITREFNPDLIDNAVESFDKDWDESKSIIDFTPKDFEAFGVGPEGLIRKVLSTDEG